MEEFHDKSVQAIIRIANYAISTREAFHVVLAGGEAPQPIYARLKEMETDWNKWHIYFGDERCLPTSHPERNSLMASSAWIGHVPIPFAQIHAIPAEQGAESGAKAYSEMLGQVQAFDLVLLGLGEDGHTASLFPGNEYGEADDFPAAMAVQNAPKPPKQRITLSAWRLSSAKQVFFLVHGKAKQAAVAEWRNGTGLPAGAIAPTAGVDIMMLQDAYF